jgi:pyruvate formate lyase activating enzyme
MTPEELYEKLKIDELYFLATGGGVTFGGGEPLLQAEFIKRFRSLCGSSWHLCAETSLCVPWEKVKTAAECIDMFYIDCKDTNPEIYRSYTGKDNSLMLENLEKLLKIIPSERIVVRVPLIPKFNTNEDRQKTKKLLSDMGITQFDFFEYKIKSRK